jgi:crossover junction endodeoxyribonuclease RuvC
MTIMGIDPGIARMGYGFVSPDKMGKLCCIDFGYIKTPPGLETPKRLKLLREGLESITRKYRPEVAAIEKLFFTTNAKTAISVAQARGVILETLASYGIETREYTPLQVKQAVTGYGKADKLQVQKMVATLLRLEEIPKPDDASDALAIAICAANSTLNYSV